MISQILRSLVQKSGKLSKEFVNIDQEICKYEYEDEIVKRIADKWTNKEIALPNVFIDKIPYRAYLTLDSTKSHQSYIKYDFMGKDQRTEFGDLIILVDYILVDTSGDSQLLSNKISVLQAKREHNGTINIIPHQHYLMEHWPKFRFGGKRWNIKTAPDIFSFYVFFRDQSKSGSTCGTVLSAPYITKALGGINYQLQTTRFRPTSLDPGELYRNPDRKGDQWDILTKPFYRFLKDSALQYVGTESLELRRFIRDKFGIELLFPGSKSPPKGTTAFDENARPTYLLPISVTAERIEEGGEDKIKKKPSDFEHKLGHLPLHGGFEKPMAI